MTTPEQHAAWRAEFEAWKTDSGWNSFAYEPMREAYLAACRARHAEAEALRAENKRLREALDTLPLSIQDDIIDALAGKEEGMITLAELLTMCTYGKGRIVCTNDMTTLQIAEARKDGRMWVDENNFGYVLLPWDCACAKDLARDAQPVWSDKP